MTRLPSVLLAVARRGGLTPAPADDPRGAEEVRQGGRGQAHPDQTNPLTLIDVRLKEQYDAVYIRGAVSIPVNELPSRLPEVPRRDVVVLYRACPHQLARGAFKVLYPGGYRNMMIVDRRLPGWAEKRYPVRKTAPKR